MRFFKLVLTLIIGAFAIACSNEEVVEIVDLGNSTMTTSRWISQSKAILIGERFMSNLNPSRKSNFRKPDDIQYVLRNSVSRSSSDLPDTLAYILNYPQNSGFVIVSGLNRGKQILAFSETGSFSMENETVQNNFIDKIEAYSIIAGDRPILKDSSEMVDDTMLEYFKISPKIKMTLYYYEPWDKYVSIDHPGCPVGCVAIASGLLMSHCKHLLTFKDNLYIFPSIVEAIYKQQNPSGGNLSTHGMYASMDYETAVDKMATLLYDIGKEIDMKYTPGSSGANTSRAINLLKSLGYEVEARQDYHGGQNVTKFLKDSNILYVEGVDKEYHAWIIDGGYYKIDSETGDYTDEYFHCDWGWGGYCNGYYTGDVFSLINDSNWSPILYYPVKTKFKY